MRQRFGLVNSNSRLICLVVAVTFVSTTPCSLFAQSGKISPHQTIISQIQRQGFKKVAVLPRAIVQKLDLDDDAKSTVTTKNTLGPVATLLAGELNDELINAPDKNFEVVPESTVLRAIAGKKLSDVDQDEFWKLIKEKTGADGGVYETIIDNGPVDGGQSGSQSLGVKVHLVKTLDNKHVGSQTTIYEKSLSDAAYAGESFVIHEWQNGKLRSTGLSKEPYFGMGVAREREIYANLLGGLGHPLQREGYPYGVAVVVNGEVRKPVELDGNLYVPLRMGEKYQLQIWNTGAETVFAGVYVDGLNTIGQSRERPSDTDTNRTWWLRPTGERAATIEGWFNHDAANNNQVKVNEFVVTGAEESLAQTTLSPGEETFGASNGMITAVFYTYGLKGVPELKAATRPIPDSAIGTGKGAAIDSRVSEFETDKQLKGVMLSAMTIYYRTPEQIAQLEKDLKEQALMVDVDNKPGDSLNPTKRPKEATVTPEELEKLSQSGSLDQSDSKEESEPMPEKKDAQKSDSQKDAAKKEEEKPKRKEEQPKKAEKPKGLAPGSDKP